MGRIGRGLEQRSAAQQLKRIATIEAIARAVNSTLEIDVVLDTIVGVVTARTDWRICAVNMADEASDTVPFIAVSGQQHFDSNYPLSGSLTQRALETGKPVAVTDARRMRSNATLRENARTHGYAAVLVIPLGLSSPAGCLWLAGREPHKHSDEEIAFAQTIAEHAAIAIRNARTMGQMRALLRARDHARLAREAVLRQHADGHGTDAMLATIAGLVDGAIVLVDDLTLPILCVSADPRGDESTIGSAIAEAVASGAAATLAGTEVLGKQGSLLVPAARLVPSLPGKVLVQVLSAGEQILGYLFVHVAASRESANDIETIVESASLALVLEAVRTQAVTETEARLGSSLLSELLQDGAADASETLRRGRLLGLDLREPMALTLFRVESRPGENVDVALELTQRLARMLPQVWPGGAVTLDGDSAMVFLPVSLGTRAADSRVAVRQLYERLGYVYRSGESLSAVTGAVCEHLPEYPIAHGEYTRALDLRLFTGDLFSVNDLGMFRFLLQLESTAALRSFVESALGCMVEGRASDRDIKTITTYLRLNGNLRKTSEALAIHISTLRYRLDRIEERCGLDLKDPDTRLRLHLALRTAEVFPALSVDFAPRSG